jgi:two-component system sensor histidine kinase ResE
MKIKNRLYLSAVITAVLVLIVFSAMLLNSNKIARENEKYESALGMQKDVFQLNIITHEYCLYHEERMQEQWYLIYDSMGGILEEESMRADYIALGDSFRQLTESYERRQELIKEGASQEEIDVVLASEERLTAQLLIKSQSISTEASRIAAETHARMDEVQKTTNNLIIALMAILAIVVSFASFTVAESINRPIKKLMDGTRIIGKGNLDHRIDITSDDEIGELAVAFDEMNKVRKEVGEALQKAHDGLEIKVEERTEELTAANEELTASQEELHNSNEELTSINEELTATQNELQTLNQDLEARVKERTKKLRGEITARKGAEEKLEKTYAELEEAYEELKSLDTLKTNIISNVSHELRTPVTIIRGTLELARDEEDPSHRDMLLKTALGALIRQNYIVGDLIEAATMGSETKKLNLEAVDLYDTLLMIQGEFKPTLEKNKIKLELNIEEDLPRVQADHKKLEHILRNLIGNAIKFNKPEGSITIKAGKKKDAVETCVSDTGVGIPEDKLDKIFDRLYQIDSSTVRIYGGTGLGLAIVKELVEVHGGKITVASEERKGCTFCFTLPISKGD